MEMLMLVIWVFFPDLDDKSYKNWNGWKSYKVHTGRFGCGCKGNTLQVLKPAAANSSWLNKERKNKHYAPTTVCLVLALTWVAFATATEASSIDYLSCRVLPVLPISQEAITICIVVSTLQSKAGVLSIATIAALISSWWQHLCCCYHCVSVSLCFTWVETFQWVMSIQHA